MNWIAWAWLANAVMCLVSGNLAAAFPCLMIVLYETVWTKPEQPRRSGDA